MFGKPVDETRAKTVGLYFLQNKTNSTLLKDAKNLQLVYKVNATIGDALEERAIFYVFNVDNVGYIIVSGDDTVIPILAYSDSGNFNIANIPPTLNEWIEGYKKEMISILTNDIKATDEIEKLWNIQNTERNSNTTLTTNSVLPLLVTIAWGQGDNPSYPKYKDKCPRDANGISVTGCVATAMAQIMKKWNYPSTGSGFHSYIHPIYGPLNSNFATWAYQWASMPDQLNSTSTPTQIDEVAHLMSDCGISVNMDYSPNVSNSFVTIRSPNPQANAEYAFKTYFDYDSSIHSINKYNNSLDFYSDPDWKVLLKAELDAGRPILYAGYGIPDPPTTPPTPESGHAFVCDGYDSNDFFHFNWGWDGLGNNYFNIGQLNPNPSGPGTIIYHWNNRNQAVIGIKPSTSVESNNLVLNSSVTPSLTTINYGSAFTVSTNVINIGTTNFSGDYMMGVFDINYNWIENVQVKTSYSLSAGNTYASSLIFSTSGLLSVLPGTYYLGFYYRTTNGNWKLIQYSGSFTNFTQLNVINYNDIELYSSINVSPSATTVTQGQSASFNVNVKNWGTSTYIGTYNLSLYNLDGTLAQNISSNNESTGLPVNNNYVSPLSFSTSSISVNTGTYLVVLRYSSGSNWLIAGSTFYQNPIIITILPAPLSPDIYEVNDDETNAYNLPVNFIGNNANVNTSGSNIHISGNPGPPLNLGDVDFYKITLPSGYNYTISPRLHDSFNSVNGNIYTVDAKFFYSTDNGNTILGPFDDIHPNNSFILNSGGTIYFTVISAFLKTGTYLLDVNITRSLPQTVISQVYGGGGNSGAPFTNDYIELFNRGTVSQNLNGWSVQYTSATGPTSGNVWFTTPLPNFTLQPGQYFLIKCAGSGTNNLPSEDAISTISLSSTTGKVVLVSDSIPETSVNPTGAQIIDKVGYGSNTTSTTGYEGSGPTGTLLSNTTAAFRMLNGCSDTDSNPNDFSVGTPIPRNSSSPVNNCSSSLSVSQNTIASLVVFPNPTHYKVFFDNANSNFKEVAMYNYLGQEVSKTSFTSISNNQEVDMSVLSAGVYILKFSNLEISQSIKVVKQ
jgi:hypothetical protein